MVMVKGLMKSKSALILLFRCWTVTMAAQLARLIVTLTVAVLLVKNIAKGTTDPRVEFISQDHSSQFTNLKHITISESGLSINFKISTKHQYLD